MRKISLFFILAATLLLLPLEAGAGRVTPDRARRVAGNFFSLNPLTRAGSDLKMVSSDDEMYMFSRPGGGFVIVSGEDAAIPVLGYSFNGDISGKMPENMVAWLDGYRKQIQALRSRGTSQDEATARLWNNLEFPTRAVGADGYEEIMNLTTADWNQGSPFNKECPQIDGKPALTGCVATAAAIVARYHRWPRHGYGTITAYSFEYKEQHYQVPARTLGREYDWDNMPYSVDNKTSESQTAAIAAIMADIGIACHASYGIDGTGAFTETLVNVMKKNFDYSQDAVLEYRDRFKDSVWIQKIRADLNETGPVLYSADNGETGHQFLLTGYDRNNNFFINWGWGGSYNGYFPLDVFRPGSSDEDWYRYNHDAIFGMKPNEGEEPASDRVDEATSITYAPDSRLMTIQSLQDVTYVLADPSGAKVNDVSVISKEGKYILIHADRLKKSGVYTLTLTRSEDNAKTIRFNWRVEE